MKSHRERGRDVGRGRSGLGSMHREPDVGFDPGSPGSHPGPKAGAKPLSHPGIPKSNSILELENYFNTYNQINYNVHL